MVSMKSSIPLYQLGFLKWLWWPDWKAVCICRQTPSTQSKEQESYLKDLTDVINFMEKNDNTRESIYVTSLYMNKQYVKHTNVTMKGNPPSQHNSAWTVHWKKSYLQTHGTAMGTKMAVAFSIIFMGKVESNSIWSINKDDVTKFPLSSLRLKFPTRKPGFH